jgi:hypothetical protein
MKQSDFREVTMSTLRSTIGGVVLGLLVIGCDKAKEPPKPTASINASNPSDKSVAAPSSALPPSDAAIKPKPAVENANADPAVTSQASPKELSKQQESTAMPLPGQVNNHSTPAPLDKK